MDWFASLLKIRCPFCGEAIGSCARVCAACARKMASQEREAPVHAEIDGLFVTAAFSYEDWVRSLVLRQKQNSRGPAVRWLARALFRRMPPTWNAIPVIWLPGAPFRKAHLVEAVALELARLGQPLAPRSLLSRRLLPRRPQKALDVGGRHKRQFNGTYRAIRGLFPPPNTPVLLLDDVITTGSTLLGCRRALSERLGLRVAGAIALAYTPRRLVAHTRHADMGRSSPV